MARLAGISFGNALMFMWMFRFDVNSWYIGSIANSQMVKLWSILYLVKVRDSWSKTKGVITFIIDNYLSVGLTISRLAGQPRKERWCPFWNDDRELLHMVFPKGNWFLGAVSNLDQFYNRSNRKRPIIIITESPFHILTSPSPVVTCWPPSDHFATLSSRKISIVVNFRRNIQEAGPMEYQHVRHSS